MKSNKLAIATIVALGLQVVACNHETDHDTQKGHDSAHWSYEGKTGPTHWASLSEENALCGTGTQQSPIDITESTTSDLAPLTFNYSPIPLSIENNGHTIKVGADTAGLLKIGDDEYQLLQFHSHSPSEGAINGERADMVVHMVHKNTKDQLAVVAVFFKVGETANPVIDALWKVTPKTAGKAQQHETQIDIKQLLPDDLNYYTFDGSLTTPPCSEGVRWVILKQTVSISAEQLTQYQTLYPHNARPLQALNDRKVLSSN